MTRPLALILAAVFSSISAHAQDIKPTGFSYEELTSGNGMRGENWVNALFGPDGALYLLQTYCGPPEGRNHKLSRVLANAGR
jgi:hypothetical protein